MSLHSQLTAFVSVLLLALLVMSQISENVWLGSILEASNFQWLKSKGITHILNVAYEIPNFFSNYFVYKKLPLDDSLSQDIKPALILSYVFIDNVLRRGGKIFIHCHAGISRSSSMLIHYLMRKYGITYDNAKIYVRQRRNIIRPNPYFQYQLKNINVAKVEAN